MTILVLCKLVNWQIDSGCSDGLCISVVLMHLCGAKRASAWHDHCHPVSDAAGCRALQYSTEGTSALGSLLN